MTETGTSRESTEAHRAAPAGTSGDGVEDQESRRDREERRWATAKKWALRIVPATLILVALLHFGPKLIYSFSHESTDDAYVGGTIVPISAEVGGRVVALYFQEHHAVRQGAPLLEIDPTDYRNDLDQRQAALQGARDQANEIRASIEEGRRALAAARADLGAARVQADLSRKERDRYAGLLSVGAISQSELDHVDAQWKVDSARADAAEAQVSRQRATLARLRAQAQLQQSAIAQAQTGLESARIQLGRTVVTAPVSGAVAMKSVDVGQVIQPGTPLLAIVRTDSLYVDANFKETQIGEIRVGQPVQIHVDAYPDIQFHGHVGSFQPGAGAVFSLLPPENATGNFVKVVRRVPVRIWFDSPPDPKHPLWPGLSAVPHVDTNVKVSPGAASDSAVRSADPPTTH